MTRKSTPNEQQARNDAKPVPQADHRAMRGYAHSPAKQALVNTRAAMRAAEMIERGPSELIPHPNDLLMAELRNIERYLMIALEAEGDSAQIVGRNVER